MEIKGLNKTGLVLEGGGLRGVYTSGVLRFFMDKTLYFPYVIGVSMGACNGANYVARQPERNRIVNIQFVNDRRYLSYIRLLTGGELFGVPFIFDTIPNELVPFDFRSFLKSPQKLVVGTTDCFTGQPIYFEHRQPDIDILKVLQASCSLPLLSRPVLYRGSTLMDGGVSDSIPIRKSIADGNMKNVLVLTQPPNYRKKRPRYMSLIRFRYSKYPGLCDRLARRYLDYNETMDFIERLEDRKAVFVIRPETPLGIRRAERNRERLYLAYDRGYNDAQKCYASLSEYLNNSAQS